MNDRVDVVVKMTNMASGRIRGKCGFNDVSMVDYSAAGRIWLLSNAGSMHHVVSGNAPSAFVLAVGNFSWAGNAKGNEVFPIAAREKCSPPTSTTT